MGLFSSIGNIGKSLVKHIAPVMMKAVTPLASKILARVAGDIFQKGAAFAQKALAATSLSNPLKALAQKILGKGVQQLAHLAQAGNFEKLLNSLVDMVTKRNVAGVGNVALDGIGTKRRQKAIADNDPYYEPFDKVKSPSKKTDEKKTDDKKTDGKKGGKTDEEKTGSGSKASSKGDRPPDPLKGKDAESIEKQQEFNRQMFSYQQRLSVMQTYWQMMSNIQKSSDDTKKALIQNLR